jgi:hypothetical protein
MNKLLLMIMACSFYLSVSNVHSYELATHSKITYFAYSLSQLNSNNLAIQKRHGIDAWILSNSSKNNPFGVANGEYYFDISGSQVFSRSVKGYELNVMSDIRLDDDSLKLSGWLMRGAIREDDGGLVAGFFQPRDDPYGNFNRFCNHFLDPIYVRSGVGRGFSGFCLFESPIYDAAQWALGTQSPFSAQPPENTGRRNHFTILDARDSMWRALTLKEKGGADVPKFGFTGEEVRKIYWATTFRSIGSVIHLLQDQGQPQHTRNEGHGGSNKGYEEYLDDRAIGKSEHKIDGLTLKVVSGQLPDLTYGGYSKPQFARYSDYWSTKLQNGVQSAGLTDYSNRGFFTLDTNFGNTVYPLPSSQLSNYTPSSVFQSAVGGSFRYLSGTVNDGLTGGSDVITMTTQGIFSEMGLAGSIPIAPIRKYTLSKQNYDDRAALLIPRAVAYSAGLIDYFFRGSLKIVAPDEGVFGILDHSMSADNCKNDCGFKKVKLKLANTTPDILVSGGGIAPQSMTSGTVVAVAKFRKNNCYTTDLNGEYDSSTDSRSVTQYVADCRSAEESITVSQPLTVAAIPRCDPASTSSPTDCEQKATPLTFNFDNPIPINATDLYLQVVYRGTLGDEADAVVVETLDIAEPTYYLIVNNTDYLVCYNSAWYYKNPDGSLPSTIPPITNSGIIGGVFQSKPYASWLVSFQPNEGNLYTKRVAEVNNIAPKEYARFAILIEKGRRYNNAIAGYTSPVPPPYTLIGTAVHKTEYAANGNSIDYLTNYKDDSTIRQLKANIPLFGYEYYSDPAPERSCAGVPLPPPPTNPAYTKPTVMKPVTLYFPD